MVCPSREIDSGLACPHLGLISAVMHVVAAGQTSETPPGGDFLVINLRGSAERVPRKHGRDARDAQNTY